MMWLSINFNIIREKHETNTHYQSLIKNKMSENNISSGGGRGGGSDN